jgi:hypothetical protein
MRNRINIDETKFIERLEVLKETLQLHIDEVQELRRLMKKYDGKAFNCRIPEAITKEGKYTASIFKSSYSNRKSLQICLKDYHVPEPVRDWYISDYMFNEYVDIQGKEIELNRRFNYAAFDTFCKEKIQKYRQYLADVERDLLDGIQRLREAEQVARYYKQLISSFSEYTQSTYNRNFQQNYFRN